MPDKKIAYILSKFPVLTETFITREIQELRKKGITVKVFSLKNTKDEEVLHNIDLELTKTVHYYPYLFSLKNWSALFFYFRIKPLSCSMILIKILTTHIRNPIYFLKTIAVIPKAFAIAKELREQNINNVHAHWATIPTTVAWIISKLNNARYTFTAHAWDIYQVDIMLEDKLNDAAKVITISEYNKRYLIEKFPTTDPEKIRVIHCGVDLRKFNPSEIKKNKIFTILSVGRLTQKKGFDVLLRACSLLNNKKLPIKCKIVFVKGDFEKEIFELYDNLNLEEYVELIHGLRQDELLDCYNRADCFVLPCIISDDNDRDGIPVVILEALAMEIPVVSTNVSGIPEVVINNQTGLVVEPNNAEDLANTIEKLYLDEKLRTTLGLKGRQLVEQQFEISTNVDRLLSCILYKYHEFRLQKR